MSYLLRYARSCTCRICYVTLDLVLVVSVTLRSILYLSYLLRYARSCTCRICYVTLDLAVCTQIVYKVPIIWTGLHKRHLNLSVD